MAGAVRQVGEAKFFADGRGLMQASGTHQFLRSAPGGLVGARESILMEGGKWPGRAVGTGGGGSRRPRLSIPGLPRAPCAHHTNRAAHRSCQPIERDFGQADVSSERKSVNLRSPRSAYSLATL